MTTTAQAIERCDKQCGICGVVIPHRTEWWNNFPKIYVNQSQIYEIGGTQVCIPCKESFGDQRFSHNQSLLRAEVKAWAFAFEPLKSSGDVEAWVYELEALNFNWHPDDGFSTQVWMNQDGKRCVWVASSPFDNSGSMLIDDGRVNGEYIPQGQRDALDKRLNEAYELVSSDELYTFISEAEEKQKLDNMMGYRD